MRLRVLGVVTLLLLVLGGCSEDNQVGKGLDAERLRGGGDGPRLGETTTTEAPPPTTAAPVTTAPPTTRPAPVTTAPRPTTTQAPATTAQAGPNIALTIEIFGDNSGRPQFDPRTAAVRVGGIVRFQNQDSQPRSVEEQSAAFRSPSIPPGGFWDYKANKAGRFDYVDGTRPYAVGQLTVS